MLDTYRGMRSFQEASARTLEMTFGQNRTRRPSSGRYSYRKPNRFYYEMGDGKEGITIVCDGKKLWIYSQSYGKYTVQSAPADLPAARDAMHGWGQTVLDAFAFMQGDDPLRDALAVRLQGAAKLRGVPVAIVELRGGPQDRGLGDSVTRLYIGQKDHLLYRSETRQSRKSPPERPGLPPVKMSRQIIQTHLFPKVNPTIPDATFTFRPPPGAKQVAGF